MDVEKKVGSVGGASNETVSNETSKQAYEAPRLRHLGSVRAPTLGGTGGKGDKFSASGAKSSTRDAKEAIHYLTAEERTRVASDVLGLRLATYNYRPEVGEAPGRHFGFIIEDSPEAAFVRPEEKVVDVYAFATALAAVVQEQQASIRRLEAELASLKQRA